MARIRKRRVTSFKNSRSTRACLECRLRKRFAMAGLAPPPGLAKMTKYRIRNALSANKGLNYRKARRRRGGNAFIGH